MVEVVEDTVTPAASDSRPPENGGPAAESRAISFRRILYFSHFCVDGGARRFLRMMEVEVVVVVVRVGYPSGRGGLEAYTGVIPVVFLVAGGGSWVPRLGLEVLC